LSSDEFRHERPVTAPTPGTGAPPLPRLVLFARAIVGFFAVLAIPLAAVILARGENVLSFLLGMLMAASAFAVGLVVVQRLPGHRVGWALIGIGIYPAIYPLLDLYLHAPGSRPGLDVVATLFDRSEVLLWALLAWLFQTFPDGEYASVRWSRFSGLLFVLAFGAILAIALEPGPLSFYVEYSSPFGIPGFPGRIIMEVAYWAAFLGMLVSLGSVIARWRRADRQLRAQLKWLAFSAQLMFTAVIPGALLTDVTSFYTDGRFVDDAVWTVLLPVWGASVPIAIGIAVTRYHLYDIDRIISRTFSWALVTATLVAVFAGAVIGLQALLAPITANNTLAVAASTLLAAALFQPLRTRVQAGVDRRFNRARHDAQRSIEAFGAGLRDEVDLVRLRGGLVSVAGRTVEPSAAGVWLRRTGGAAGD